MKAYRLLRDYDRSVLADNLTRLEQEAENLQVLAMNSVSYHFGDDQELVIETLVLVSYETGDEPPAD